MTLIYYIIVVLAHLISLPFLPFFIFKSKYKGSLKSRMIYPKGFKISEDFDYWLHVCSVGEVNSIFAIIKKIKEQKILLTVITKTGFERAKELYKNENIEIRYLPFETFLPFVAPKCKNLYVFEAEYWLMLFFIAKKQGAGTKLINARISQKSFKRYQKLRIFYAHLFNFVDVILSQSEVDKNRILKLGAKNVSAIGNIKIMNDVVPTKNYIKGNKKIIILASTHEGEEETLLNQCKKFLEFEKSFIVLVAPRHPERFNKVYKICSTLFDTEKFSNLDSNFLQNTKKEVIVIDALGELINFYSIADIVVLCGSFVEVGGHNPIECAFFNTVLISGKHIFNQHELFKMIENIYFIDINELLFTLTIYNELKKTILKIDKKNMIDKILL